jgi:hypothetical protein
MLSSENLRCYLGSLTNVFLYVKMERASFQEDARDEKRLFLFHAQNKWQNRAVIALCGLFANVQQHFELKMSQYTWTVSGKTSVSQLTSW